MAKNTEIELKLVVSKDNLKKLLALDCVTDTLRADSMQKRKLVSSYYDTEDLAFKRQGIAYRVRSKGDGTYEATVKTSVQNAAGLSERMELNLPLASARPKLEGFGDLGLPTANPIQPAFHNQSRSTGTPYFHSEITNWIERVPLNSLISG